MKLLSKGLRLTEQEVKIIEYLYPREGKEIFWEELAQFAKDPQTVKLKTMQKVVSEIKRKYASAGLPPPFDVSFTLLARKEQLEKEPFNEEKVERSFPKMVQVKKVVTETRPQAQIDFELDRNQKRVKTKFGYRVLNDSEWEVFKYIHARAGKLVTISELRDEVVYPKYGSKLPARWFDSIMRIVNNLRRQVDGLNTRLLTVKGTETSYLFQ